MMNINFSDTDYEYITYMYPSDIAENLIILSGSEESDNEEYKEGIKEALYQLKAMAQNEYNCDYWRMFVHVLSLISTRVNDGDFEEMED